jgi:hypothetical protein
MDNHGELIRHQSKQSFSCPNFNELLLPMKQLLFETIHFIANIEQGIMYVSIANFQAFHS